MNWKLILQLSLFGLAMGVATVFWIPARVEPAFWLAILGVSAYLIAARCADRYFLHGLLVGVANGVWVTASHVLWFTRFLAGHPDEAAMISSMPLPDSPRIMMVVIGPVIGVVSGCLIGLLAVVAARLLRRPAAAVRGP